MGKKITIELALHDNTEKPVLSLTDYKFRNLLVLTEYGLSEQWYERPWKDVMGWIYMQEVEDKVKEARGK